MVTLILKASRLIVGYSFLGIGLLITFAVIKLMLAVFPEILFSEVLGVVFVALGLWILEKVKS